MNKKVVLLAFVSVFLLSMTRGTWFIIPVAVHPAVIRVPEDYERIQWAVDAASAGDTILVAAGTYYENVVVNKAVSLIGENRSTTIIDGGGIGKVIEVSANNVTITGFTIRNSGPTDDDGGIWVNYYWWFIGYSNHTIRGNNITNNNIGIRLGGSNHNDIVDNFITSNKDGILLGWSHHNSITNNFIADNTEYGIYSGGYGRNTITGNIISNNQYGISLWESSNNTIFHNNFINNIQQVYDFSWDYPDSHPSINVWDDTYLSGGNYWSDYTGVDSYCGPYQNETGSDGIGDTSYVIDANNQDDYPLMNPWTPPPPPPPVHNIDTGLNYATTQEAIDAPQTLDGHTIVVDAGTYYEHVTVYKSLTLIGENASTTIIDGNETGPSYYHRYLVHITAHNVSISGFTIQKSLYCIFVDGSSGNNISHNIITNNSVGIYLNYSSNNILNSNIISNNDEGILLTYSSNNTLTGNTVFSSDSCGILLEGSNNNALTGNNVSNNPDVGIYLLNSNNNTLTGNIVSLNVRFYGIALDNSSNNTITDNNASNNDYGIWLRSSSDNTVNGNTASNNGHAGIYLGGSSNNTLTGNTVLNNGNYGISLSYSSSNTLYHNDFINTKQVYSYNSINTWDGGYPSGGNYWSDYMGVDSYCGPYQNETGSDGIGDTPYVIDKNNKDNYPLMRPWGVVPDTTPPTTTDDYDGLWHTTDFTITLTATDDISGVAETYYKINDGPTKSVSVNGQPIIATESASNTLKYWSVDKAGNEGTRKILTGIKLDKTVPTANAGQNRTVNVDEIITFDAGNSTDNIGIVSYEWNFGDGTTGTGVTANHTYTSPGTYTVTLTVKDVAGNTATHQVTVTVSPVEAPPPEAFPMWIVGVAVVTIAIATVAIAVFWRRRKQPPIKG